MRRFFTVAIPVFIIGFAVGNAFWYLASPLWIDRVVSESLPEEFQVSAIASGEFKGADSAHQGRGKAEILQTGSGAFVLRLSDFEVTNGPDLKVYLSAARNPVKSSDVLAARFVSLGPLKGNIGDQNYILPGDIDVTNFGSVVIWCEQFSVLFASAGL
ncbi:MAG: DM13 domain-containing protein [Alphaproteobacteria bacterium]|nr:DM13 domain-containing protein [Alphaproteobacteria bacterium]